MSESYERQIRLAEIARIYQEIESNGAAMARVTSEAMVIGAELIKREASK